MAIVVKDVDASVTDSKLALFMAADRERGWRLIRQERPKSKRFRCHNFYDAPPGTEPEWWRAGMDARHTDDQDDRTATAQ